MGFDDILEFLKIKPPYRIGQLYIRTRQYKINDNNNFYCFSFIFLSRQKNFKATSILSFVHTAKSKVEVKSNQRTNSK